MVSFFSFEDIKDLCQIYPNLESKDQHKELKKNFLQSIEQFLQTKGVIIPKNTTEFEELLKKIKEEDLKKYGRSRI